MTPSPAPTLFSLTNGTIRATDQTVCPHVNFTIKPGEHWALVGDHETAKTTLLETIAGRSTVAAGHTQFPFLDQFRQENPTDDLALTMQKPVALVSVRHNFSSLSRGTEFYYQQRYNASDAGNAPTVEQYLTHVKSFRTQPLWTYARTVAALRLDDLLAKQLIKLSNGETRRVLLAAALLRNPVLLLLDQPLIGLDVNTRLVFNQLLTEIAQSGITVVLTTSPTELPDAITHVAIWNQDQPIQTIRKTDFNPPDWTAPSDRAPDEAVIRDLLPTTDRPLFETLVGMEDVTIRYGEKIILEDINWTVRPGERWALLGHNGAGKSTLLSLINGDNPQAYANRITLFDRRRGTGESIWDIKRNIGFVSPELFQYFPGGTACQHVIESGFYDTQGLFRPSKPDKAALVLRWMKLLKIETLAGKLFRHVSITDQRLCLLARALVKSPPLLLLDEPCQGFSATQQAQFRQLIDALCQNSNIALIYVSHYQQDIPSCVTQVLRLSAGKRV